MKTFIPLVLAAFIFVISAPIAFGQKATSINFPRGTHETVVTGKLNGYASSKTYVIRVGKNQTITTEDVGKNPISLTIIGPKGSNYEQEMAADCHSRNEITPTVAGTYRITVTQCTKADEWKGTFKFKITAK